MCWMETWAGFESRRPGAPGLLAVPALAMLLLAAAPATLRADTTATADVKPLQEAVKAGGSQPVRFVLADGGVVVGRIVRVDEEALTIRRPSAGLRSLALVDIVGVNIKAADGELHRGVLMHMTDGGIGWMAADDDANPDRQIADAEADAKADAGGPLISLGDVAIDQADAPTEGTPNETAAVETIAVKPADAEDPIVVTPQAVNPEGSGKISLNVTADKTSEDDKLIYFRLTLSRPAEQSILVIYTMINDTAVAPGDYTHRQGVIVFEPGETQTVVATTIVNDDAAEGAESFIFFVTADPSAVSIDQRKVMATIEDNDG